MPDYTLDAGLLARSQYPEGPATGHLDTGFSWFRSPPDLNFLVNFFHICVHVK